MNPANLRTTVSAMITIDLADPNESHEFRRRLGHLDMVPTGALVMLLVGETQPGYEVAHLLRSHQERLHFLINGTDRPDRVRDWYHALNDHQWGL